MSRKIVVIAGAFVLLSGCSQIGGLMVEPTPTITPTATSTTTPTLAPTPTPQPLPEEILALLEGWAEVQEDYTGLAIQAGEDGWEVVIERVDGGEAITFQIEHWGESLRHPDFPNAGWVLVDGDGEVRWFSYPDARGKLRWMERISAEDILARAVQRIDISVPLAGTALIEGEKVELNFPDLQPQITVMLDPTNTVPFEGRSRDGVKYEEFAVKEITLATDWYQENLPGGSAELQFTSDLLYIHYHAWRYDKDGEYLNERQDVSFTDWLTMIQNGETDGSHDLRLKMDKSNKELSPGEKVESKMRIKPLDPMIIVAGDYREEDSPFVGGSSNEINDFAFDPVSGSFIFVSDVRVGEGHLDSGPWDGPWAKMDQSYFFKNVSYLDFYSAGLIKMVFPETYQYGDKTPTGLLYNKILNEARQAHYLFYALYPDKYYIPFLFVSSNSDYKW